MELGSEDEFMLVSVLILKRRLRRNSSKKKKASRSVWVKAILREREMFGDYHRLIQSMKMADRENFFQYVTIFSIYWYLLLHFIMRNAYINFVILGIYECPQKDLSISCS